MLLAAPLLTPSLVAPARYYLGIDTGTQSTKAIVYDATQRLIVGRGAVNHGLNPTNVVGRAEQDPEVWVDAMWRAGRAAQRDEAAKQRPERLQSRELLLLPY